MTQQQAPPGPGRVAGPGRFGIRPATNPYLILAIVLPATFMQLVDISIVNVAIPSIQRELDASYADVQLVLAGYQLAFAATLITSARMGDLFGRRRLFLTGMVGFVAFSALCGAAPSAGVLIGARFGQGLFSGLMFPQVLSVIQVTFAPRDRGKAFGILGAVIGIATIIGPLLGGVLIKLDIAGLDWRTIFYVNVPIGVAAFLAALLRLGESRAPEANRLDLLGALLVTAGLVLLIYPLTEGRQQGWPPYMYLMLGASLPVLAIFTAYQVRKTRRRDSPLLLMSLFGDRSFRVGLPLSLVFFMGLVPYFFVVTLYLQIGFGFSALEAGLTTFPFAIGSGIASANSNRITERIGTNVLALATAVLVVGMLAIIGVVHLAGTDLHSWELWGVFLLAGAGLGLFVAPMNSVILAGIKAEGAGSASGVLSTAQQAGGALGVALIGVLFFGLLGSNAAGSADRVVPRLRHDLAAAGLPGPAVAAVVGGFRTCFTDRLHAEDPTAEPASCLALQRGARAGAPPRVAHAVERAVRDEAAVQARRHDFARSLEQTLFFQVGVFALAFLLVVFALPKVNPAAAAHGPPVPE